MKRRSFLEGLFAASALRPLTAAPFVPQEPAPAAPDPAVKRVLVMFKCHLDVGFIDTQANVVRKYFDGIFPRPFEPPPPCARQGKDRYVWTTGSWLLYEYLEQAAAPDRQTHGAGHARRGHRVARHPLHLADRIDGPLDDLRRRWDFRIRWIAASAAPPPAPR